MIVIRRWTTVQEITLVKWNRKVSQWRGVYLFGFIPLHIEEYEFSYEIYVEDPNAAR